MKTFRLKSILATLMMVLVSGNVWAEEVIVGTGTTERDYLPLYSYSYNSSTTECIYTPDELKGAGVIYL